MNISKEAQQIYAVLKQKGMLHESDLIQIFHPKPAYPIQCIPKEYRAFWQYEADMYGGTFERPVKHPDGTVTNEKFSCDAKNSLDAKIYPFWVELKNAGLAIAQNNGFNCYTYFPA